MSSKINWLLNNITSGEILLQSWLSSHGITPQLARKYCQSQWLVKLGVGVYYRAGRKPRWQNAVYCLQNQSRYMIHLAGLTSLAQQGKSHYLQFAANSIWINVQAKTILPKWFKNFPELVVSDELIPNWEIIKTSKLNTQDDNDLTAVEVDGIKLKASNQELAAYEVLEAVPSTLSFEHAAELFQGLVNLSPRKVEHILKRSGSIQTNRLFLFLGHFYKHPWAERVNESVINLGAGKRQIVPDGKLEKQYQITVPEQFISSD
ncbi:TPA: type IV toxin-antitoxin system AbiEi family antitoxin [Legionella pneumophila]|nr:type IV toxin-antitoxin system AbiEi family antitoxin [Legionella pneumophila]HDO7858184.1 type IV toxin-antitoxin system AbiEi family antitoxin [Legionella pneumophila]